LITFFASLIIAAPYDLIAIALMISLLLLDKKTALIFTPYVLYLIFANIWGYKLWRLNLNRTPSGAA
jgi:tryptophan-rich sensory protein